MSAQSCVYAPSMGSGCRPAASNAPLAASRMSCHVADAARVEGAAFSVGQRHSPTVEVSARERRERCRVDHEGRAPAGLRWSPRGSGVRNRASGVARCAGAYRGGEVAIAVRSATGRSLRVPAPRWSPRHAVGRSGGTTVDGVRRVRWDEGAPVAGQQDRSGVKGALPAPGVNLFATIHAGRVRLRTGAVSRHPLPVTDSRARGTRVAATSRPVVGACGCVAHTPRPLAAPSAGRRRGIVARKRWSSSGSAESAGRPLDPASGRFSSRRRWRTPRRKDHDPMNLPPRQRRRPRLRCPRAGSPSRTLRATNCDAERSRCPRVRIGRRHRGVLPPAACRATALRGDTALREAQSYTGS